MADNTHTVHQDELGPDGFVVRDAVPTSDVIRIRFADIDGLRALAIVMVAFAVLVHYAMQAPSALALRLAAIGSQGITLFFVISGFTLAFPAMAVLRQDGRTYLDIGRFTLRRLIRIYPTYLFVVVLTVAVGSFIGKFSAAGFHAANPVSMIPNLFFVGDGFGNDGLRAVALFVRSYIFFPVLVWLWTRRPIAFAGVAVACAILDLLTPAHAWSLAAFVPFMLGIVAADLRAQVHRFERVAPLIAVASAAIALVVAPFMVTLPGFTSAPHAINIDPFWSLFFFGLVVSVAAYRPLESFFSFWLFRLIGAASYSISLCLVPIAGLLAAVFPYYGVPFFLPVAFVLGCAVWQAVDRGFNDSDLRRNISAEHAVSIDEVLAKVHVDRVFLGGPPPVEVDEDDLPVAHQEEFVPNFYAPPPRASAADLAIVSRRTGSPEELQNAILETKARLQERSAALFAEDEALRNPVQAPVFAKPGFYRKPAKQADADDAATLEPLVGGAVSGPTPEDDEEAPAAQAPAEAYEPGPTVKHTISAKPAAPAKPAEPIAPPISNEEPQASKEPAIRIRISSPTDGVVKNG